MAKRYIQNNKHHVDFVGGVMLQPGEGREVDELYLPPQEEPEMAPAAPGGQGEELDPARLDANLLELMKGGLKQLVPGLKDMSDATLARMAELEGAHEAPRKGLLEAITALQLDRAQAKAGGAPT
jgi:hypothetical protein